MDEEALSNYVEELKDFKQYAANHLEGEFNAFVLEQIGIIERGINSYPIVGAKALREGTAFAFANLVMNQDLYENNEYPEVKGRLKKIVKKFVALAPKSVLWGAQLVNAADTIKEITSG